MPCCFTPRMASLTTSLILLNAKRANTNRRPWWVNRILCQPSQQICSHGEQHAGCLDRRPPMSGQLRQLWARHSLNFNLLLHRAPLNRRSILNIVLAPLSPNLRELVHCTATWAFVRSFCRTACGRCLPSPSPRERFFADRKAGTLRRKPHKY